MGYKLRREVRAALPPGKLTAAERLLVLELADLCNDRTREGWPGVEVLAEVTDLSPRSIQETLSRIAAKWIELRVKLGTDRHGRAYYSHAGKRTTFRFPPLTPVSTTVHPQDTDSPGEGAMDPGASEEKGAMDRGASTPDGAMDRGAFTPDGAMDPGASEEKGAMDPGLRCDRSGGLLLNEPLKDSLSPSATPSTTERETEAPPKFQTRGHRAVAKLGVAPELVDFVVKSLTKKHSIRSPQWWTTVTANGDLAELVDEVLASARRGSAAPALSLSHDEHRVAVGRQPECPHGDPGGNVPHPEDGWMPCVQCRKTRRPAQVIELAERLAG